MIGVNSMIVKEFNPSGIVSAREVKLVELSLADTDFIRNGLVKKAVRVKDMYDTEFTIHAPFQNSAIEHLRVKLSEIRPENFKIMRKVFEVCDKIDARRVVVHAGDVIDNNMQKSLQNVVRNLREICKMGKDYEIALENLYTENGVRRVCETPEELKFVLENVNADNLCVNLDIGHAYLTHKQLNIPFESFFEELRDYIRHMHIHNNYGTRDDHNPLNRGLIDPKCINCKTDVKILEVKNGTREEVFRSMSMIF